MGRKHLFSDWNVKAWFYLGNTAAQVDCYFTCVDAKRKRVSLLHTVTAFRTFGQPKRWVFGMVGFILLYVFPQVNLKALEVFRGLFAVRFDHRNEPFLFRFDIFPEDKFIVIGNFCI
jgi:hypothetical protein